MCTFLLLRGKDRIYSSFNRRMLQIIIIFYGVENKVISLQGQEYYFPEERLQHLLKINLSEQPEIVRTIVLQLFYNSSTIVLQS